MTEMLTDFDPADHLTSDQAIVDFMSDALATNDPSYVAHALGVVVRARGQTDIADRTRLSRVQLDRSFRAGGDPTLRTVLALLDSLGLRLAAKPAGEGGDR